MEEGRNYYLLPDPVLGWRGRPHYAGELSQYPGVRVNLDANGWRVLPGNPAGSVRPVTFYGCSYLFGVGVEDDETFAARLARKLPEMRITAKGVQGYSTVQSLRLLQRDLRSKDKPQLAIFAFLDVHPMRNLAGPKFLYDLASIRREEPGQAQFPLLRAGLDIHGQLRIRKIDGYVPPDWSKAAGRFQPDPFYANLVTEKLVQEAKAQTDRFGCEFAIALLRRDIHPEATTLLVERFKALGINVVDVSFPRQSNFDISPTDAHPNAAGHKRLSDMLEDYLRANDRVMGDSYS